MPALTRLRGISIVTALVAAALTLTTAPATASGDPTSPPPATSIVSVGEANLGILDSQFSADYNATNPSRAFYRWGANGSPTFIPKAGCPTYNRPYSGYLGIDLLKSSAKVGANYCVDIARSELPPVAGDGSNGALAFVSYGKDAITWSANSGGNAPATLTTAQLKAIYSCNAQLLGTGRTGRVTWDEIGGTSTDAVVPAIPKYPSRADIGTAFLSKIGVTTLGSCVLGQAGEIAEDEGTDSTLSGSQSANVMVPYSAATYLAQTLHGQGAGQQGNLTMRSVNGVAPQVTSGSTTTINPAFPYSFSIFHVVRDNGTTSHVPTYLQPLLGAGTDTGWVCTNATAKADLESAGFLSLGSNCGSVFVAKNGS